MKLCAFREGRSQPSISSNAKKARARPLGAPVPDASGDLADPIEA